jgi:alpha-ketoglutarate-dependent taurine dioxygenase
MAKAARVLVPERRTRYETFELRTLTPHIGAEIRGLDVSKPLDRTQAAELEQAFLDWMVLAIPRSCRSLRPRSLRTRRVTAGTPT